MKAYVCLVLESVWKAMMKIVVRWKQRRQANFAISNLTSMAFLAWPTFASTTYLAQGFNLVHTNNAPVCDCQPAACVRMQCMKLGLQCFWHA